MSTVYKLRNILTECQLYNNLLQQNLVEAAEQFQNKTTEERLSVLEEDDTVLLTASFMGHQEFLLTLLSPFSSQQCLNILKRSTCTALHVAASQGRVESVQAILKCVADTHHQRELLDLKDGEGNTAIDLVPTYREDIRQVLRLANSSSHVDDTSPKKVDETERHLLSVKSAQPPPPPIIKITGPDTTRLEALKNRVYGVDPKLVYEMVLITKHMMDLENKMEQLRADHLHEISGLRSELHSRTKNPDYNNNYGDAGLDGEYFETSNQSITPIVARRAIQLAQDWTQDSHRFSDNSKPGSFATPGSLKSDEESARPVSTSESLSMKISFSSTASTKEPTYEEIPLRVNKSADDETLTDNDEIGRGAVGLGARQWVAQTEETDARSASPVNTVVENPRRVSVALTVQRFEESYNQQRPHLRRLKRTKSVPLL